MCNTIWFLTAGHVFFWLACHFKVAFSCIEQRLKVKSPCCSDSHHYFCGEVETTVDNDILNKIHLRHTFF